MGTRVRTPPTSTSTSTSTSNSGGATIEEVFESEGEGDRTSTHKPEMYKPKMYKPEMYKPEMHKPELYMEDEEETLYRYDSDSDSDLYKPRRRPIFKENMCEYSVKKPNKK